MMRLLPPSDRKLARFLTAVALTGVVSGLYEPTFNNYLSDVFMIGAERRGMIELPREMPGFCVMIVAGALSSLALNRAAALALALVGVGLLALAHTPGHFAGLLAAMIIWSTGAHLNMPISNSITLSFASSERRASSLGGMGAVNTLGVIVGAGAVALLMHLRVISYRGAYIAASCFAFLAAGAVLSMGRLEKPGQARRRVFVLKRRYWLYYTLSAIFGARKQVFMTFGPWVIVKIFGAGPVLLPVLWIVFSVLNLFTQPAVGRLIDRWGERKSLVFEGFVLSAVCVAYSVAGTFPGARIAFVAVMAAYIVDNACFSLSMARTTYLSRIVEEPEDLPGGLAAGVSIDHAVSMSVPTLGGFVWAAFGFEYVFWGAAVIALVSSAASLYITIPQRAAAIAAETAS